MKVTLNINIRKLFDFVLVVIAAGVLPSLIQKLYEHIVKLSFISIVDIMCISFNIWLIWTNIEDHSSSYDD